MGDRDLDVRNEHLAAGLHAEEEPLCDVSVWCDSATSRVTRWTLMARHGVRRDRSIGRMKCPICRGAAWWQAADLLGDDGQDEATHDRQGLAGHLLFPFRRPGKEVAEVELDCVACRAYQLNDMDGEVYQATMIMDGNGVCDEHAASMLKVLADRLPERTDR